MDGQICNRKGIKQERIMLIYDEKKYKIRTLDDEMVTTIERQYGVKVLFAGSFGTCVYGIHNRFSDVDFRCICDSRENPHWRHYDKETMTDIWALDIVYAKEQGKRYLKQVRQFPSVLYRDKGKKVDAYDIIRDDFGIQIFLEILYSDYIWDSGYLKEHYEKLLMETSLLSSVDYYYSRAYGHRHNHLEMDTVNARYVLMCFVNVCICKWLVKNGSVPYVDCCSLIEYYAPREFKDWLVAVLCAQKAITLQSRSSLGDIHTNIERFGTEDLFAVSVEKLRKDGEPQERKPKAYVENCPKFLAWIDKQLEELAYAMNQIPIDRGIVLGKNSLYARAITGKA